MMAMLLVPQHSIGTVSMCDIYVNLPYLKDSYLKIEK